MLLLLEGLEAKCFLPNSPKTFQSLEGTPPGVVEGGSEGGGDKRDRGRDSERDGDGDGGDIDNVDGDAKYFALAEGDCDGAGGLPGGAASRGGHTEGSGPDLQGEGATTE